MKNNTKNKMKAVVKEIIIIKTEGLKTGICVILYLTFKPIHTTNILNKGKCSTSFKNIKLSFFLKENLLVQKLLNNVILQMTKFLIYISNIQIYN